MLSKTVKEVPSMNYRRVHHSSFIIDSNLYVLGGTSRLFSRHEAVKSFEVLNLKSMYQWCDIYTNEESIIKPYQLSNPINSD